MAVLDRFRLADEGVTLPVPAVGAASGAAAGLVSARSVEEMLDLARRDADAIRRQAREEGRREGLAEARAQMRDRLERLDSVLRVAGEERHRLMREAEMEMVALAVAVARHVVEADAGLLQAATAVAVSDALAAVNVETFTLRLHPDDLGAVQHERAGLGLPPAAALEADPRVGRGGCVLEGARGTLDARLATRMDLLAEHLREDSAHGD